ncbi:MAG: hypothetical protein Q7S74_00410 [Nanoarchaeota archaeon]|nr:hypothetical protein [Nanoarchaeota archaeon]
MEHSFQRIMKKGYSIGIIVALIFLVVIFSFIFFIWYSTSQGDEYFEFRSHGIKPDKMYSNVGGPAEEFRNTVEGRLESHITIPENYNFYFTEKINAGEWERSRSFTLHMNWVDENGFSYDVMANTHTASLSGTNLIRIDVYKKGVTDLLTFKDYQGDDYNYEEDKDSAFEEPDFVDDMREQVKLVIKNPELTLAYMQTSRGKYEFTTNFIFDDPNPGGIFRKGATKVEFNFETEEMRIRYFAHS